VIGSTRQVTVYAFDKPVDMRRSFDGLYGLIKGTLGRDPLSGDLYLFVSRNRRRAKVLFWDGTGLCVFAKRLEQGCFTAPWHGKPGTPLTMTTTELQLLLEGSKLAGRLPLSPPNFVLKGVI
jgi:transposase